MKAINFVSEFAAQKPLKLAFMSDWHADSPDCDLVSLKRDLAICKKEGRHIILGGDLFDAIIHTDKKRFTPSRNCDNRDDQINAKLEILFSLTKDYADNIIFIGRGNHCLIEDSEVLTTDGFKPIKEIIKSDLVASYNTEKDKIEYHNPLEIQHIDYTGDMYIYENQGLNFGVSPDHRMFGIGQTGKPYYKKAKEFSQSSSYKALCAVHSKSIGISLSDDELQLLGWLLTDSHIPQRGGAIIYQSKEPQVSEIRNLLNKMGISYKETKRNRKIKSICGKLLKSCLPNYEFRLHLESIRELKSIAQNNWFELMKNSDDRQFNVFLDTLIRADGNIPKTSKLSCAIHGKKEILEKFQILCFLHGIRSSISKTTRGHYVLNVTKMETAELKAWGKNVKKIKNPFDKIYCMTMPNSNFVCRRNGRIMVTGNCESILKYSSTDILDLLIKQLNLIKTNGEIILGNYQNFLRFDFIRKGDKKSLAHYDILQHHGAGASAPVTKGAIDFNRIIHGTNVDLVVLGHKHHANFLGSDPIMYIDVSGEVKIKNRQAIMTPSYAKGRSIDYNVNFAERFYTHQSLSGFASLDLTPTWEDNKATLKSDIAMRINSVAKIGDLQNVLIRKKLNDRQNTK